MPQHLQNHVNPLSTAGLLTWLLIGSYHEMFNYEANYDIALKISHLKTFTKHFLTLSLIGSINGAIGPLSNQQVDLMDLNIVSADV